MLTVVCMGLSSCSKDEDEKQPDNPLVGTWVTEDDRTMMVFHADGTGYVIENQLAPNSPEQYFDYAFDSRIMVLTLKWVEPREDQNLVEGIMVTVDGNILKTFERVGDDPNIFIKK